MHHPGDRYHGVCVDREGYITLLQKAIDVQLYVNSFFSSAHTLPFKSLESIRFVCFLIEVCNAH